MNQSSNPTDMPFARGLRRAFIAITPPATILIRFGPSLQGIWCARIKARRAFWLKDRHGPNLAPSPLPPELANFLAGIAVLRVFALPGNCSWMERSCSRGFLLSERRGWGEEG